jgi:hypothetical protein
MSSPAAILAELSESPRTQFGKVDFEKQTYVQKIFSSVWSVASEVGNGGFCLYFENSSAETAKFAVRAMCAIGADQIAQIVKEAIDVAFPDGLPSHYEEIRQIAAAGFSEQILNELDRIGQLYFQCKQDPDLLLFHYVQEHPEEFGELVS